MFSCFGIPMFYVYMLLTFYVHFTYSCMAMLHTKRKINYSIFTLLFFIIIDIFKLRMLNTLFGIFIFIQNFFTPANSLNIHHYFNYTFHEFKVLKKDIITGTFNVDFHYKFIKFLFILFFYFFSYIYIYIYIYVYVFFNPVNPELGKIPSW